ncbi:ATP-binding protein [Mastigocoleus sp. MO_188.B34]|uniref:sensor histidine kinase n=1 Tax=Mastigocoleus sp. MO_188.B34 TaxID=3036635 RepID=UPI002614D88B|nr:ATP-binding protein [Mastigocoleus sp. MO_188.B34]MDJ0695188.1 ATP-binding protein [Mastigocoleus sp. MO_188.B34]
MLNSSENTELNGIFSRIKFRKKSNKSQSSQNSFHKFLNHLNVSQKIGFGYGVAIGIAICGTMSGIVTSNYYKSKARQKEQHAHEQVEIVRRLQASILQSRTHQQQFIPLVNQPKDLKDEYSHFLEHAATVRKTWSEIKSFVSHTNTKGEDHGVHADGIPKLLQTYRGIPEAYFQEIQHILQKIDSSSNLDSPEKIANAQKLLLDFTNSPLALKFDGISDDLTELVKISDHHYFEAEEFIKNTERIQFWVAFVSISLSTTLAILFAYYISISISRPLKDLTHIAKEVTQKSNFELQASTTTTDEVGVLATSFNQMIFKVKELLAEQINTNQKLESYNDNLEEKVEKRTQELIEKNFILEKTLKELKKTQGQLIQNEKMSSLGQLVAGIAHEINNPVNFIHGNLSHADEYIQDLLGLVEIYQEEYPEPTTKVQEEIESIDLDFLNEDLPKLLASMKVGSLRIREIIKSLRNFSRLDESEYKQADIHEGIDSTLMILQNRLKVKAESSGIEIVKNYGELPLVECYPGQLNQVFMNLISNAIDALDEYKQQSKQEKNTGLSTEDVRATKSQIRISTQTLDSKSVAICIADNGPGIPGNTISRLFDPFFTTKEVGKGTGLGLAISHQIIVEKHNGKLECLSRLGEGTEFIIKIPITQITTS